MTVIELTPKRFDADFRRAATIFDTTRFANLNAHKVDEVLYLGIYRDEDATRPLLGLITGRRGHNLYAPFSAPFAMMRFNACPSLELTFEAIGALKLYLKRNNYSLQWTLPPAIYGGTLNAMLTGVLEATGARKLYSNFNQHFPADKAHIFEESLESRVRNKLRTARRRGLYTKEIDPADFKEAYAVILANRLEHGYPLRMSAEDVEKTIRIVPARFFVTVDPIEGNIAACQAFRTADDVWQIIYWGDRTEFSRLRPMNLLANDVISALCADPAINSVDIGPSSEDGVPNFGLAEFKASIGCEMLMKPTYLIQPS